MSQAKTDIKDQIADGFSAKRKPSGGHNRDFLVDAWQQTDGDWRKIVFHATAVDHIYTAPWQGDQSSVIVLGSGREIMVNLDVDALEKKIYASTLAFGERLDLLKATEPGTIEMKPGAVAADGSIYLGLYDGKDCFVTDRSSRLKMDFNAASFEASSWLAHGRNDWQVPSRELLDEMIRNRDEGGFAGTYQRGDWYWSSTKATPDTGWQQLCFDGKMVSHATLADKALARYVRLVPKR